jgi:RNA recognition motif-containing protein
MEYEMKIYVGNLSSGTTEVQLRESFVKFGEIAALNIATDRGTQTSRGFAFVDMSSEPQAQAAIIGLHGQELDGHVLKVNAARRVNPKA